MKVAAAITILTCVALGVATVAGIGQTPPKDACTSIRAPGDSGVFVNLANDVTPATIAHAKAAIAAGKPRILHWAPDLAAAHRRASLKGVPTRPGFDRDEYPPAASEEGGAGADVALIPSSDNRSSGQRMGAVMHPFCNGQSFIIEP